MKNDPAGRRQGSAPLKGRRAGATMTEKEKGRAGCLFTPSGDPALREELLRAKSLCFEYNRLPPECAAARRDLLRLILGGTGERFLIEQPFYCDYGYNITIGEDFYANHNCVILDGAPVTFGNHVFIAPNCGFYTAGHPLDAEQRNSGLEYVFPIRVGDDVWIGGNSAVLPGAVIGNGTVIGAGSVVKGSIPPGVLAAGNPCRVVRDLTPADRDRYRA